MPVSIPRRPGCHGHFCRGARAKGWKEVQDTVREGERQGFSFLGTLFKQLLPCSTPLFLLLGFVFSFAPVSLLRRVTRRADVEGDERPDGLRQQPGHADRGLDCGRGAHHDDVPHGEAKGEHEIYTCAQMFVRFVDQAKDLAMCWYLFPVCAGLLLATRLLSCSSG